MAVMMRKKLLPIIHVSIIATLICNNVTMAEGGDSCRGKKSQLSSSLSPSLELLSGSLQKGFLGVLPSPPPLQEMLNALAIGEIHVDDYQSNNNLSGMVSERIVHSNVIKYLSESGHAPDKKLSFSILSVAGDHLPGIREKINKILSFEKLPVIWLSGALYEDCILKVASIAAMQAIRADKPLVLLLNEAEIQGEKKPLIRDSFRNFMRTLSVNASLYINGKLVCRNTVLQDEIDAIVFCISTGGSFNPEHFLSGVRAAYPRRNPDNTRALLKLLEHTGIPAEDYLPVGKSLFAFAREQGLFEANAFNLITEVLKHENLAAGIESKGELMQLFQELWETAQIITTQSHPDADRVKNLSITELTFFVQTIAPHLKNIAELSESLSLAEELSGMEGHLQEKQLGQFMRIRRIGEVADLSIRLGARSAKSILESIKNISAEIDLPHMDPFEESFFSLLQALSRQETGLEEFNKHLNQILVQINAPLSISNRDQLDQLFLRDELFEFAIDLCDRLCPDEVVSVLAGINQDRNERMIRADTQKRVLRFMRTLMQSPALIPHASSQEWIRFYEEAGEQIISIVNITSSEKISSAKTEDLRKAADFVRTFIGFFADRGQAYDMTRLLISKEEDESEGNTYYFSEVSEVTNFVARLANVPVINSLLVYSNGQPLEDVTGRPLQGRTYVTDYETMNRAVVWIRKKIESDTGLPREDKGLSSFFVAWVNLIEEMGLSLEDTPVDGLIEQLERVQPGESSLSYQDAFLLSRLPEALKPFQPHMRDMNTLMLFVSTCAQYLRTNGSMVFPALKVSNAVFSNRQIAAEITSAAQWDEKMRAVFGLLDAILPSEIEKGQYTNFEAIIFEAIAELLAEYPDTINSFDAFLSKLREMVDIARLSIMPKKYGSGITHHYPTAAKLKAYFRSVIARELKELDMSVNPEALRAVNQSL